MTVLSDRSLTTTIGREPVVRRRLLVMRLYQTGLSHSDVLRMVIAHYKSDKKSDELPAGYNEHSVYIDVQEELYHIRNELTQTAEETRTLELTRLDHLQQKWWNRATLGYKKKELNPITGMVEEIDMPPDPKAAELILRFMDKRHKLLGLDAPITVRTDYRNQLLGLLLKGDISREEVETLLGKDFRKSVV